MANSNKEENVAEMLVDMTEEKPKKVAYLKSLVLSPADRELGLKKILRIPDPDKPDEVLALPAEEMKEQWSCYLKRHVASSNWMAVWISSNEEDKKYVDVAEVYFDIMRAKVIILKGSEDEEQQGEEVEEKEEESVEVSLLDLFPIQGDSPDDNVTDEAVHALEYCRFFFKYIWRPWDEDDDTEDWAEDYLSHRICLYEEYQQLGEYSQSWRKFENLAWEYRELVEERDDISSRQNLGVDTREDDIAVLMDIEDKLSALKFKSLKLQDREVRLSSIVLDHNRRRVDREGKKPMVNVVMPVGTLRSSKELLEMIEAEVDPDTPVKFYSLASEAISNAIYFDTIVLHNGNHITEDLGEMHKGGGKIIGIGSEVKLICRIKYKEEDLQDLTFQNVLFIQ